MLRKTGSKTYSGSELTNASPSARVTQVLQLNFRADFCSRAGEPWQKGLTGAVEVCHGR
jgi:hypothetical protein